MKNMSAISDESRTSAEDLLRSYVEGDDQAAFAEIYRRYAGIVYSVARRYVKSDADAEDVSTACFVVLAQKAGTLKGRNITGWLYWRAMSVAGNLVKISRRRTVREQEVAKMSPEISEEKEEVDLVLSVVEKEIAALPEKQREAIVLQYYQGLSGAEIAAAMHCARGAVAALIHRGMEKLRARLARLGMGDLDVERSLSSSALLLPVPAGMWVKLSGVLSGQLADGPVVELVKGAIKQMLLAKVKVAAAVVGAIAFPAAITAVAVLGPMREEKAASIPASGTNIVAPTQTNSPDNSDANGEVLFKDDFEHGLDGWDIFVEDENGNCKPADERARKRARICEVKRGSVTTLCLEIDASGMGAQWINVTLKKSFVDDGIALDAEQMISLPTSGNSSGSCRIGCVLAVPASGRLLQSVDGVQRLEAWQTLHNEYVASKSADGKTLVAWRSSMDRRLRQSGESLCEEDKPVEYVLRLSTRGAKLLVDKVELRRLARQKSAK